MDSKERITLVLQGKPVDRIPVVAWFNLRYCHEVTEVKGSLTDFHFSQLLLAEKFGLDPCIFAYAGEFSTWPGKLYDWLEKDKENWREKEEVLERHEDYSIIKRTVTTPEGSIFYIFGSRFPFEVWPIQYYIKKEEDLKILKYRPDPEKVDTMPLKELVKKAGRDAFIIGQVYGVWDEATRYRGLDKLALDIYDRPEWVKSFLSLLKNYTIKLALKLCQTGVDAIMLNETGVGMGLSLQVFNQFIFPQDKEIVEAIQKEGVFVSYHICGRCSALLERMADTGAKAVETLTSVENNADVDLSDAKQRIGERVCLFGGFNERLFYKGDKEAVRQEVRRCIDTVGKDGGYILRPMGQVIKAKEENLRTYAEEAKEYGKY